MEEFTNNTMVETLRRLIEEKKYTSARDVLETMHAADIAAILGETEGDAVPILFRLLPKGLAADTFVEMDDDQQELLIHSFSDNELREVLDELYMDDAADLVGEMPANVVKRILRHVTPERRKTINELLKYPEDSAGSIMTTEFVSLRADMDVEDAIKRIRRTGVDKETINTCYVLGIHGKLLGIVTIRELLLADENAVMQDIMTEDVISALTTEDREDVARNFTKYDLSAMPVVDEENRLVGIVTVDDVMDVLEEETTEDIEKMAAIMPLDKPYLKTPVLDTFKSRIPWLLILMVLSTFTSMIITGFENSLQAQIALTACIPMLMGMGGNCGSQSSVTIIRGISIGEIEFGDMLKIIWKEVRVAVLCGLVLAVANFIKLQVLEGISAEISLVVSVTLVLVVLVAKIVGSALPLIADKIHLDPAVMASPFITTIVDALSLIIYFEIAQIMLGI